MKHRSVIGFVIVAAALFSLPQLSHDLQSLKSAVGARMHRELLQAFLNLPAGDPVAASPVARPSETWLASCTQRERSGAPAAKPVRAGREAGRGRSIEQSAMIVDPAHDPMNNVGGVELNDAADVVVAALAEAKVETEVAMIIPPEYGIDPRGTAKTLGASNAARVEADRIRAGAESLRVAYAASARSHEKNAEWQKATEDAFRRLNGTYEFRVVRDGSKAKVLKLKCNTCPTAAPSAPRAPRQMPPLAPLPADWASE